MRYGAEQKRLTLSTLYSRFLARGPQHAAVEDRPHLRHVEFLCDVAERGIEDTPPAISPLPGYRHDDTLDPRQMLTRERRGRKHFVRRVDMHVVLLRPVGEALDAAADRILRLHNVDAVVDDVARMCDPLAAAHELVFDRFAERVAHAAVISSQP